MWPYRSKSARKDKKNDDAPKINNPDFNHRSFKDTQTLFPHSHNDSNAIQEQPSSSSQPCSTDVKSIFHRVHLANRLARSFSARPKPNAEEIHKELNELPPPVKPENSVRKTDPPITIPGADKRVVVYMTSLRAVRSTFEACRTVRSILQGFRVPVDERDLTMDSSYVDEIRKIMAQIGQGRGDTSVSLPRVFIGGRYIGGADEVVELHEIGELKKFVAGLPAVTPGVCESCGGFRFILCYECDGSHKCHMEDGGFTTCTACNENGLIRCPSCISS